ncbi:MAG: DEAD/DEAH box helicase family protein [Pseudomonadales bacterium]|nr:DEAD/DEAH box helicase family protein [Pseudomonadales bacterium]
MSEHVTKPSNFSFLSIWGAYQELQQRAQNAEANIKSDPRVGAFYARNCLELMVETVFDFDKWINRPRHDASLMSLIHEKDFKRNLKHNLFPKLKLIIKIGNEAVHGKTPPPQRDALQAVKELHHVLYWFARTYTPDLDRNTFKVEPFDEKLIPQTVAIDAQLAISTAKTIKELKKKLADEDQARRENEQKLLNENEELKAKNTALLEQVAQSKAASEKAEDKHDYNEAETRHYLIDNLLLEAGWDLDKFERQDNLPKSRWREREVKDMPISPANPKGNGFADYVLWGDDGAPLAVVEAKRTSLSPESGKTQAKLYADCLEKEFGQRPVIFYSNGYETRLWDDTQYPPRTVQGFYTKGELALLIKRRTDRQSFFDKGGFSAEINDDITNRHYQKTAITHVLEHFEKERERKALLVMATGTGKTRTVISLVDLLTKHAWVKNVLFLADRNALLTQAKKNFVKQVPRISCTILDSNLQKGRLDSRLYFSTYPTMNNLLDRNAEDRPFGVGHFDLVVVDEAHRSVYQKYKQIFEYFDGFLVGLTATPKDEADKDTYAIFDLQAGMPTYAYEDADAYAEKFLVPPTKISVATKFIREGVKYDELSKEEQEEWEQNEELAERNEVLPTELNTFLFNKDTARKMFKQLLSKDVHGGIHVEGGDVIGKTIIFAANNDHADFLQKVFDENYPKWKGKLAQVITYKNKYAQSLIDEFSVEGEEFDPENPKLRIAISVDMLDTGIDVREVVNLVFLKVVHSKVKFTQMLGRGTRLCENLFGPAKDGSDDKKTFKVFDYCQNFEFFHANPAGVVTGLAKPIGRQVFEKRVKLSALLSSSLEKDQEEEQEKEPNEALAALRTYQLDMLHHQVVGMNLDNFIVRPKRQYIEPFLAREHWDTIDDTKYTELETHISALPTEADAFNEDEHVSNLANRFDNLVLTMQLSLLESGRVPEASRVRVMEFAQQLEGKTTIPAILAELALIQAVQTIEFWQDIHLTTLETIRRKFRNFMFALDKEEKEVVYTDFKDEVTGVRNVTAVYSSPALDLAQYRKKTELYIKEHQDHITIQKLKRNKPITQSDLDILEELLIKASGVKDREAYREKVLENKPLGSFIRQLVGLDINAAKEAFSDFLDEDKVVDLLGRIRAINSNAAAGDCEVA